MAKPPITTRQGKGAALTWAEGDANLTNLQNASNPDGGTTGQILAKTSNTDYDYAWVNPGSFQGIQGIQGTAGYIGADGSQGIQGVQGTAGYIGADGSQGIQGVQGLDGAFAGQGIQGVQGAQGTQGVQGDLGIQGSVGAQGIQGTQGTTGEQGVQGVQGVQGFDGGQGVQGFIGSTGSQGIQGTQAAQGIQGRQGIQGNVGFGAQGTTGTQGVQGRQGLQGASVQGAQGVGQGYSYGFRNNPSPSLNGNYPTGGEVAFYSTQNQLWISQSTNRSQDLYNLINRYLTIQTTIRGQITIVISNTGATTSFNILGGAYYGSWDLFVLDIDRIGAPALGSSNTECYITFSFAGDQGVQGIQGVQGQQGIQGAVGQGFKIGRSYLSVSALQADTPPIGVNIGEFGLIETGDVENPENSRLYLWDGNNWVYVNDLSGAVGIQGTMGLQGPQGNVGAQGIPGSVAAQGIQGIQGVQGIQGIDGGQGLQGITGDQGIQGVQGTIGDQGLQGMDGAFAGQGIQGIQGVQGNVGIGSQGPPGNDGVQGVQGVQGRQGTQGIEGRLTGFRYTWTNTTTPASGQIGYVGNTLYVHNTSGDSSVILAQELQQYVNITGANRGRVIVKRSGSDYNVLNINSASQPNGISTAGLTVLTGTWAGTNFPSVGTQVIVEFTYSGSQGIQGVQGTQSAQGVQGRQGVQGAQGTQWTYRATWNSSNSYQKHDVVSYNGSSYIYLSSNPGDTSSPTQNPMTWYLIAGQGVQGVQGTDANVQGIQGTQGTAGYTGIDGAQGTQGVQGVQGIQSLGFRWRGGWYSSSTFINDDGTTGSIKFPITFKVNDVVRDNGVDTWVCKQEFTLTSSWLPSYFPNSYNGYWSLFLPGGLRGFIGPAGSSGETGAQGVQGIQGTQGDTGLQGIPGQNFRIAKYYSSYADLLADTLPQDINPGEFAIIVSSPQDEANSKIYLWTGEAYQFVNDLSGLDGLQGPMGAPGTNGNQGIQGTQGTMPDLLSVSSHIIPTTTLAYDLGSPQKKWRSLYIGAQTIYLGDYAVSVDQGYITVDGSTQIGPPGAAGSQGIQGIQGESGYIGQDGSQGVQGIQGYTGPQGDLGVQGIAGATGMDGIPGSQGVQGLIGYNGADGAQGTQGVQGATGQDGTIGADGLQGTQGIQGIQGSDANVQGIQGVQGATGTTGNQGTQGIKGTDANVQGIQGIQGATGTTGNQGIQGTAANVQGIQGTQGTTGQTGTTGNQGIQGIKGTDANVQGIQGTQGIQGVQGLDGAYAAQGVRGISSSIFDYRIDTSANSGDPGMGKIRYNANSTFSRNSVTFNSYNALIDTNTKKFGTGSLNFRRDQDGTPRAITTNDPARLLGTGPFTIEGWFNAIGSPQGWIFTQGLNLENLGGYMLAIKPGEVRLRPRGDGFTIPFDSVWNTDGGLSGFVHYAFTYSDGVWELFQNGISQGTRQNAVNIYDTNQTLYIGNYAPGLGAQYAYLGYVDEIRVSNIRRYTSNFNVPTEPFSNDANTIWLLHFDGDYQDDNSSIIHTTSTQLYISKTGLNSQVNTNYLKLLKLGTRFIIEDKANPANYQVWRMTGSVNDNGAYLGLPAAIVESGGTGSTNLANLLDVDFGLDTGFQGIQGTQGAQGAQGIQGLQGASGPSTTTSQTQPGVASVGDQWFNPSTQILYVYTESGWFQVSADDLTF